jgi:hypothetical protein
VLFSRGCTRINADGTTDEHGQENKLSRLARPCCMAALHSSVFMWSHLRLSARIRG